MSMPNKGETTKFWFNQYKKFADEYGRVAVFMQVGTFLNAYEIDDGQVKGNARELSEILNVHLGRMSNTFIDGEPPPVTIENPRQVGVQLQFFEEKYLQKLLDAQFTVVLIEETTPSPCRREVTKIWSPGTFVRDGTREACWLITVLIDQLKDRLWIGATAIDVSTGDVKVFETHDTYDDLQLASNEMFQFITCYYPKEICFYGKMNPELVNNLTNGIGSVHIKGDGYDAAIKKAHWQNEFLSKIYNFNSTLISTVSHLGLDTFPLACESLCLALNFAKSQRSDLVNYIKTPVFHTYKFIDYNASLQLNLVSESTSSDFRGGNFMEKITQNYKSVLSVIDFTLTAFGYRTLYDRLLTPLVEPKDIQMRYNTVESFLNLPTSDLEFIRKGLSEICDLQRLFRKMTLGKLSFGEMINILNSLEAFMKFQSVLPVEFEFKAVEVFLTKVNSVIDRNGSIKSGIDDDLDKLQQHLYLEQVKLQGIVTQLQEEIHKSYKGKKPIDPTTLVKIVTPEREPHYLSVSNTRWNNLPESVKKKYNATKQASNVKVSSDTLRKVSENIKRLSLQVSQRTDIVFREHQERWSKEFGKELDLFVVYLAGVDVSQSTAYCARKYNYVRPKIVEGVSKIIGKNVRHPLVERLNTTEAFVPNDTMLGTNEQQGMLVYGLNTAGKTVYMKSIGVCLVLAQAGFYVPADNFEYTPFKKVFTRISGADNIFKGQSSFAVEMTELNSILRRADEHSLVIGDEICHGTEQYSGMGLVGASLLKLSEAKSKFIFATHLHGLMKFSQLKELTKLKEFHIRIEFAKNKLVYTRKLTEGSGASAYGIEVAESMGMPRDFISTAMEIRKSILPEEDTILSTTLSRYNKKLVVDKCVICETKQNRKIRLDTHHINFQCNANEQGMHGSVPKDHLSNLIPVCKECHQKIHNNTITNVKVVNTSLGREVYFSML